MTAAKALLMLSTATALQAPCTRRPRTQLAALGFAELAEQSSLAPADKSRITVLSDADAVGAEVWKRIDEAGKRAVEERGTFTLAIPGGSVLKMLAAVWKSTSVSGAPDLGDDAAVLALSSGKEPASPRHRAGVASMAWRSTRRFSTNVP